jgi:hypothetical protein
VTKNHRQNGTEPITRAEFDEIRREVHDTCRDLAENVRRELHTQFTRIAQIQQEIDELKRNHHA